ncbi:Lipoprotein activator of PBP from the outer membrane A [Raoultella planticola]|uniref:Penicillin-binding protein activator LpoA n=1 Tax=Raoultella planticola TaxID=575 RepID=A0A485DA21_RAOPL|nr:Lipoprotein activator of PBP from the outer membrane A [Raoultella planticola]
MVPSTFLRSKPARCLPVLLAALIFAGCGTHTPDQSTAFLQGTAQADSSYYLQQMQQSSNDSKTNWQLLAIRALLQEGKKQQAIDLFNQLPSNLNGTQAREQSLLAVEVKLAQNDFQGAQALLAKLDPASFEHNQQPRYWQAQIDASQGRPSITLLRALIAQQPLLSQAKQQQQNIDATWKALTSMTQDQANALIINADENVLQGWLDLQRMWFDNRNDPTLLKAGVKDWQTRYPQNPGAKMLPTALVNMQNYKPASTNKIALLLPLNGQAAVFGRTIQQGFEAAKNGAPTVAGSAVPAQVAQAANVASSDVVSPSQAEVGDLTSANTAPVPVQAPAADRAPAPVTAAAATQAAAAPEQSATSDTAATTAQPAVSAPQAQPVATTPANPSAELKIYDTTTQPMSQLLAQVQQDGATLVVGPLLKDNVEEVIKSNTSLNVLALNQPEKVENRANICYFALSPEDEARDAARHIHDQGKQTPLLLAPRGALGDRVVNAFANEWLKLGGGTVLQQRFGSASELKSSVNSGISLSGTPVSTLPSASDSSLGNPEDVPVSSSGGVDSAWILATPEQIAYIKPMIALRNGSQSNVTLYASSRSAQGTAGPDFRLEMEGLQYSEIPMLAGSNPALMQQALSAVRNDYSLARLYAMGADAWSLG